MFRPLNSRPGLLPVLILLWSLAGLSEVRSGTLEGQTFESPVRVANQELHLNGVGLRGVLMIKGYVAGLYLPRPARSLHEITSQGGARRLQLRMLRSATPEDFTSALGAGMRVNTRPAKLASLADRVTDLKAAIHAAGAAQRGDVINFDYLPGEGTVLTVNGRRQGPAIPGEDFFQAVLAIFIGERPVDPQLKKGLLRLKERTGT